MATGMMVLALGLLGQLADPVAVYPVASRIPDQNVARLTARLSARLGQSGAVGCLLGREGQGFVMASVTDCPRCSCKDPSPQPKVAITTTVERVGSRTLVTVRAVNAADNAILWAVSERVGALNVEGALDAAVDGLVMHLKGSGATTGDTGSSGGMPRKTAADPARPAPAEKGSSGGKPAR